MNHVVRRARPEESAALAALFRRAYGTLDFLPTLHEPDEDRGHFASVVAERETWVYESDGVVLGFAALADAMLTDLTSSPTGTEAGSAARCSSMRRLAGQRASSSGSSRRTKRPGASTRRAAATSCV